MALTQQERTHRRKLVENGLPLPDSASKRRGVSVPGLRGAAPRFLERDAEAARLRNAGLLWSQVGARLGVSTHTAMKAAKSHERRNKSSQMASKGAR